MPILLIQLHRPCNTKLTFINFCLKNLGSLYQDEISVEPAEVIPILATASLFQMDGLADQCANIMEETVNIETVTKYYETGVFYGSSRIQDACITWLKVNLLSHLPEHPAKLRLVLSGAAL